MAEQLKAGPMIAEKQMLFEIRGRCAPKRGAKASACMVDACNSSCLCRVNVFSSASVELHRVPLHLWVMARQAKNELLQLNTRNAVRKGAVASPAAFVFVAERRGKGGGESERMFSGSDQMEQLARHLSLPYDGAWPKLQD